MTSLAPWTTNLWCIDHAIETLRHRNDAGVGEGGGGGRRGDRAVGYPAGLVEAVARLDLVFLAGHGVPSDHGGVRRGFADAGDVKLRAAAAPELFHLEFREGEQGGGVGQVIRT